jgi:hypothetical protein
VHCLEDDSEIIVFEYIGAKAVAHYPGEDVAVFQQGNQNFGLNFLRHGLLPPLESRNQILIRLPARRPAVGFS